MAEDATPVTLLNEPVREVIELRPGQQAASLYALLVGLRNQAQALLDSAGNPGRVCGQEWPKRSGQSAICCHTASGAGAGVSSTDWSDGGPSGPLMLGPLALSSPRIFGVKEFCHQAVLA